MVDPRQWSHQLLERHRNIQRLKNLADVTVAEFQTQIWSKIKPVFNDPEYYFWFSRPEAQNI